MKEIIISYNLEEKLKVLLAELDRLEYKGYIRLSKPRQQVSRHDWEKIFEVLQNTMLETKVQEDMEPLPPFLEKRLEKILRENDFSAFQNFIEVNYEYLPQDLVRERKDTKFLSWIFARLKDKTIVLHRHQIRLGKNAKPEDLIY